MIPSPLFNVHRPHHNVYFQQAFYVIYCMYKIYWLDSHSFYFDLFFFVLRSCWYLVIVFFPFLCFEGDFSDNPPKILIIIVFVWRSFDSCSYAESRDAYFFCFFIFLFPYYFYYYFDFYIRTSLIQTKMYCIMAKTLIVCFPLLSS